MKHEPRYKCVVVACEEAKKMRLFDCLVLGYLRQDAYGNKDDGITSVTNTELSAAFDSSVRYVSLAISRLRKAGLVEQRAYDGKSRTLYVVQY